jgi:putative DNA primase/helicase
VSFAGREDLTLPARVRAEMPGIFNWALRGWTDLQQTGTFIEPSSSQQVLAEAEGVFSPIAAFLDECCIVDPAAQVTTDDMWDAWQQWCKEAKVETGNRSKLGVDLRGCLPGLQRTQSRLNGSKPYVYQGLALNDYGRSLGEEWRRGQYRRSLFK